MIHAVHPQPFSIGLNWVRVAAAYRHSQTLQPSHAVRNVPERFFPVDSSFAIGLRQFAACERWLPSLSVRPLTIPSHCDPIEYQFNNARYWMDTMPQEHFRLSEMIETGFRSRL
jgi:hypothetical protein